MLLLLLILQAEQDSTLAFVLYSVHAVTSLVASHLGHVRQSCAVLKSLLSPLCPLIVMLLLLSRFFGAMEGMVGDPLAALITCCFFRVVHQGSCLG